MKRFVTGQARGQATLFPEHLEDFIAEDNPVRVIDAFVEGLDLRELGFKRVDPLATGRPAYHPAVLLKLYIYGYLNRVQSSRRLERETQRNVELMWLTERRTPDHKTIADFRKDNGKAIRQVCRKFVLLCGRLGLFSQALVAIDGSKFKAVNNRDKNFTPQKMKRRLQELEHSIARYLAQLDDADAQEPAIAEARSQRLKEKIAALKEQMQALEALEAELRAAPDQQISLTDPDARSMMSRGVGVVGYNVQTAVEPEHHLIVAHEVVNTGSDRGQLAGMAEQAREAMGCEQLTAVADRGYYTGEEILACEQSGITTLVPKAKTSNNGARGLFSRERFRYDPQVNSYRCPAGEILTWRFRNVEAGRTLDAYWSSACPHCSLKAQCTPAAQRRIRRWEHEAVLEAVQARLDAEPESMRLRRQTVEHPFGTIKSWMGYTHFLTRRLPRVRTEMSLHVLAYNLKRVIKILGTQPLLTALRA
jgi:transposase